MYRISYPIYNNPAVNAAKKTAEQIISFLYILSLSEHFIRTSPKTIPSAGYPSHNVSGKDVHFPVGTISPRRFCTTPGFKWNLVLHIPTACIRNAVLQICIADSFHFLMIPTVRKAIPAKGSISTHSRPPIISIPVSIPIARPTS